MMIVACRDLQQDTVIRKIVTNQDSLQRKTDSVAVMIPVQSKDTARHKSITLHQNILPDYSDTTSVCTRNSIADVTFYDFNNFILRIGYGSYKQFPFILAEQGRKHQIEERAYLIKQLKPGKELPSHPLHTDWMIIIILVSAFLFSTGKK